jgi:hypothetical protein
MTIGHAVIVVRFAPAGRRRLVVLMLAMHSFPRAAFSGQFLALRRAVKLGLVTLRAALSGGAR